MSIKSDFIEALRQTPDGIAEFLTTAIPAFEPTTLPTTVDEAIITQGILAHNFNTFFSLFEGLIPIEVMLRIGQHSNVAEVIALSGLEYIGIEQAQEFEIVEPTDAKSYAPGDIRIVVKGKGNIVGVSFIVTGGEGGPAQIVLTPDESGKLFVGYARCEELVEYTFEATAEFNDDEGTTDTASVTITISDDEESEVDLTEFDLAAGAVTRSMDSVIRQAIEANFLMPDFAKPYFETLTTKFIKFIELF